MKKKVLQRREILSWIALVLVIAYDCLAVLGRRSDWDYWKYWVIGDIALLLILGIVGWMSGIKFSPRTSLIKLLANTTGARGLNLLYLFLFAINFAGLSSAILPLFQPEVKFVYAIYPLVVLTIVLMGLILFSQVYVMTKMMMRNMCSYLEYRLLIVLTENRYMILLN